VRTSSRRASLRASRPIRYCSTDYIAPAGEWSGGPFSGASLVSTAALAAEASAAPTHESYGIPPPRDADDIVSGCDRSVTARPVLDLKRGNVDPSDHFEIIEDLQLTQQYPRR
jgi:hypothetical protein